MNYSREFPCKMPLSESSIKLRNRVIILNISFISLISVVKLSILYPIDYPTMKLALLAAGVAPLLTCAVLAADQAHVLLRRAGVLLASDAKEEVQRAASACAHVPALRSTRPCPSLSLSTARHTRLPSRRKKGGVPAGHGVCDHGAPCGRRRHCPERRRLLRCNERHWSVSRPVHVGGEFGRNQLCQRRHLGIEHLHVRRRMKQVPPRCQG